MVGQGRGVMPWRSHGSGSRGTVADLNGAATQIPVQGGRKLSKTVQAEVRGDALPWRGGGGPMGMETGRPCWRWRLGPWRCVGGGGWGVHGVVGR